MYLLRFNIVIALCLLSVIATAQIDFNLNFEVIPINRNELVQKEWTHIVNELIGKQPLLLTDFQNKWMKPPYKILEEKSVIRDTTTIMGRYWFDSLCRITKIETFTSTIPSVSIITYTDSNKVSVQTTPKKEIQKAYTNLYWYDSLGRLILMKAPRAGLDMAFSIHYHYNKDGLADSIIYGKDTIRMKYDTSISSNHINYKITGKLHKGPPDKKYILAGDFDNDKLLEHEFIVVGNKVYADKPLRMYYFRKCDGNFMKYKDWEKWGSSIEVYKDRTIWKRHKPIFSYSKTIWDAIEHDYTIYKKTRIIRHRKNYKHIYQRYK